MRGQAQAALGHLPVWKAPDTACLRRASPSGHRPQGRALVTGAGADGSRSDAHSLTVDSHGACGTASGQACSDEPCVLVAEITVRRLKREAARATLARCEQTAQLYRHPFFPGPSDPMHRHPFLPDLSVSTAMRARRLER